MPGARWWAGMAMADKLIRIEAAEARARIARLVERIAVLEAALEQCRALAAGAAADRAPEYCEQIKDVAEGALDRQPA